MKKVKLMFTALGIFAFVGTALALTARETDTLFCYDPNSTEENNCTITPFLTLDDTKPPVPTPLRCTDISPEDCELLEPIQVYVGE